MSVIGARAGDRIPYALAYVPLQEWLEAHGLCMASRRAIANVILDWNCGWQGSKHIFRRLPVYSQFV